LNKNFAVEGSYTNYSSDEVGVSSMSAANGAALETAMSDELLTPSLTNGSKLSDCTK
jgi:hypothetical protein